MADKTNGAAADATPLTNKNETTSQATGLCACPRTGDLWDCAGRPAMEANPDGRRCELGELVRLGTDHDVRGELAEILAGGGDRDC